MKLPAIVQITEIDPASAWKDDTFLIGAAVAPIDIPYPPCDDGHTYLQAEVLTAEARRRLGSSKKIGILCKYKVLFK